MKVRYIKTSGNYTALPNGIQTAIGCDPSAMLCKSAKPDAPAWNSKYTFNIRCKTISSCIRMGNFNDIGSYVMSIFSLPVEVCDEIPVSYIAKHTCDNSVIIQKTIAITN